MTMPKQILPGRSYLITRSTRSRRFFSCPTDTVVNIIFMYCIARAAGISGVEVHSVCVMSTHIHLVVTDVRGELPLFTHWLFRHTAVCLKILRGINENVWTSEREYPVELLTPEAVLESMAYVMANPASADLVKQAHSWPGLVTRPVELHGCSVEVEPPPVYFRLATSATYQIVFPEMLLSHWTVDEVVEALKKRVQEFERDAETLRRQIGLAPLGLHGIARTQPFDRAKKPRREPESGDVGAGLVPRFKAMCRETLKQASERLKEFWEAYREALELFRERKEAVFPAGTWYLRVHLGVSVMPLE